MKMMKGILLLAAMAMFAAGQAYAVPVSNTNGYGEPTLQQLMDQITGGGVVNVNTDQVHPSAYWRSGGATGGSTSRLLFEFTANASQNSFGIFDPSDPSNRLTLFQGSDSPYVRASLTVTGNHYVINYQAADGTHTGGTSGDFGPDNLFGFYLDTPNGTFYSDPTLNSDGEDHQVAFVGDGTTQLDINGTTGTWLANEYIFGWEDGLGLGDQSYQDFVVAVESLSPVPEPSALAMFGLGLLGLGLGLRMTRRSRS